MILATDASFISNALRSFFGLIDGIVYWLLVQIYNLFTTIASVDLFANDIIGDFSKRIYALLGVVVLFRLTISVFTYILDPDKMSDSKTGFGSLIKNVIVMLVILTLTPFIFDKAMALQRTVLKENTISKIIIGKTKNSADGFGDQLAKDTIASFVTYDSEDTDPDGLDKTTYNESLADSSFTYKDILNKATANRKDSKGQYFYGYRYLVSTIVGGFMVYIFLIFSIDIAVRTVKLGFLKLIAPLPIVTYVDPKGRDLFNKWLKQCTSTYLDLFIRLAGIFFAQYLVTLIMDVETWKDMTTTTGENPNFLVKVFIILGCLMFAKQLPEILKGLGLNIGGKFELNPLKKISAGAVGGAAIAGGLGLAGRTLGNLGGAGVRAVGAVGRGVLVGAGTAAAVPNNGAAFATGFKHGSQSLFNDAGSYMRRIGADFGGTVGTSFTQKRDDRELANMKRVTDAVNNMENRAKDKIRNGEAKELSEQFLARQNRLNSLKNMTIEQRAQWETQNAALGMSIDDYIAKEEVSFNSWFNEDATYKYIDTFAESDKVLAGFRADYNQAVTVGKYEHKATAKEMHGQMGEFKGKSNTINRERYARQEAAKK